MNLVLDAVEEVTKNKRGGAAKRRPLGRLLLKGDNICAVCQSGSVVSGAGVLVGAGAAAAAVAVETTAVSAGTKRDSSAAAAGAVGDDEGEGEGKGAATGPSTKRARHDDARE